MSSTADRAARARVDKVAARRRMLADAALSVIADRGFAHTGLREIAEQSALSHGSLHYYFDGKDDLVAQAVWQYKSECAKRYDSVVATAATPEEFLDGITAEMSTTLRDEASLHRLWYDLRNQSLFDAGFRDTIVEIDALLERMVWNIVARYAELTGRVPLVDAPYAYALVDGMFLNALIAYVRGDAGAIDRLRSDCARLLAATV